MREISHTFAVNDTKNMLTYNAIIDRYLFRLLKIYILLSKEMIVWDSISIPMRTSIQVQDILKNNISEDYNDLYTKNLYNLYSYKTI